MPVFPCSAVQAISKEPRRCAAEVEDEFYAQDAEAARVRACMTALIGEEDPGSPCDE